MKKYFSLLWISALLAMLAFSACSNNEQLTSPGEELGEEALSLEKEFGGYESNDETTAFGDSEMADEFGEDEVAADAYATDAGMSDVLNPASAAVDGIKVCYVRITWGLLEGDSTATDAINWNGSAQVSKGTLVVLRKIRFEDNDSIVLPRTDRQLVEFTSVTKPHFDGLLLAIIDNDSTDEEGTFTFTAGDYSKTLTFSELDSLELIEPVGALGYEVSIISRCKEVVPFGGGFMAGRWVKTREHGGIFKGRWMSGNGAHAGHLKGIWGIADNGEKVFKGKIIDMNGNFRALMAGHWGYDRDNNIGGFRGRIVSRSRDTIGIVKGHFKTGRAGSRRGFFQGRFKLGNAEDSSGITDSNGSTNSGN
ncbi:hypothetical protein IH879_09800 [candidate division KSB1 bacterium]|nr:hypothetical protein [candidate division KSB1 bacterium]